jgi:hypothetical protein
MVSRDDRAEPLYAVKIVFEHHEVSHRLFALRDLVG